MNRSVCKAMFGVAIALAGTGNAAEVPSDPQASSRVEVQQLVEPMKSAIQSDRLAAPVGPFSPAISGRGFLFVSGQIGQDPSTGKLVPGGIEKEAAQVFANLAALLGAAGLKFDDAVRVGVYLTDLADFPVVNAIYSQHFVRPYPARTTIGVSALPLGAHIEIDMIVLAPR